MEFLNQSYWQKSTELKAEFKSLRGKETADILIVGGGLLGMSTAFEIKKEQPDRKVVLIEADYLGFGPSGRNGGIVYDYWTYLPELTKQIGYKEALKLAEFSERAVSEIAELDNIDLRNSGVLHISTSSYHDQAAAEKIDALTWAKRTDLVQKLTAEEIAERVVSPQFRGGVFYPNVKTVNPAKLCLALRDKLNNLGVIIYENTKLTHLSGDDQFVAETEAGAILADKVFLATGSTGQFSAKDYLTVSSSNMVITKPIENINDFWKTDAAITDERASVKYMQKTPDDRIAFGWGRGRIGNRSLVDIEEDEITIVSRALVDMFPEVGISDIEFGWGGPIDISPTHMPFILNPKNNLWLAAGFTGNGVGGTKIISKLIAPRILGIASADLTIKLPTMPPLPPKFIKNIGGQIVREAMLRKERAEESEQAPSKVDNFISALPTKFGVRINR